MKAILIKNLKQLVRIDKKAHENGYKWTTEIVFNKPQNLKELDLPCYLIITKINKKMVLCWGKEMPAEDCILVKKEEEFIFRRNNMKCIRIKNKKEIKDLSKKLYKYGFEYRSKQLFGRNMRFNSNKFDGYLVIGTYYSEIDNEFTLSYSPFDKLPEEYKDNIITMEELDEWLAKKNK